MTAGPAAVPAGTVPGLARFRWTAGAHAVGLIALAVGAAAHSLSWSVVGWLGAVSAVGHLTLYFVTRAGVGTSLRPEHAGDRIPFVHTIFSLGLLALACTLHPPLRNVALQLMFVITAADIHRLSRKQVFAVAAVGFTISAMPLLLDAHATRLIDAVTLGGCLATLLVIGRRMRWIHTRQQDQRRSLSDALAQWQTLSRHDALTGALSRRYGMELLQQEAARQQRDGQPFSIGLLDVDHFKRINDTHGHATGDQVLIDLVRVAKESLGQLHSTIRWGGEEFLVLMPATNAEDAFRMMCRLRKRIVAQDWSQMAAGLGVDVSIGVTEHRGADTIEQSVAGADGAMYVAKNEGRGRVVQAEP